MSAIVATENTLGAGRSMLTFWKRLVGSNKPSRQLHLEAKLAGREWREIELLLRDLAYTEDGEAHARDRAERLLAFYRSAGEAARRRWFTLLNETFSADDDKVQRAIQAYLEASEGRTRSQAAGNLQNCLESPRYRLLRQFNLLPNGVLALVDMRADLLQQAKGEEFAALDHDMLRLFSAWFDIGFLELKRIGWSSPAALLEKLIRYEAVHEIKSWSDLRNRLDSDRRCYAFFHGRMPEEPLIFVEVALVRGIADNVQALLDETQPTLDPDMANTAIFYSISNAQPGLRGVSMGEFLIKRVVQLLLQEYPRLRRFATLSPVPGFSRWLDKRLADGSCVPPTELAGQLAASGKPLPEAIGQLLHQELAGDRSGPNHLQKWLKGECAHYLLQEQRQGQPLDPVARFHFSNGASLGRINWLADSSRHGLRQSYGLMVNYLYTLREIDSNHRAYANNGSLAAAPEVARLLEPVRPRR
jgi:malonyl-CoA decarboxylase